MTQKIKQIIIAVVVIVVAFIGFKTFFSKPSTDNAALSADKMAGEEFVDGQVILSLLGDLGRVTLDDSVFSNPIFTSLVNFERPIQEQVTGRKNPFLPIGVEGVSTLTPAGTSTVKTR